MLKLHLSNKTCQMSWGNPSVTIVLVIDESTIYYWAGYFFILALEVTINQISHLQLLLSVSILDTHTPEGHHLCQEVICLQWCVWWNFSKAWSSMVRDWDSWWRHSYINMQIEAGWDYSLRSLNSGPRDKYFHLTMERTFRDTQGHDYPGGGLLLGCFFKAQSINTPEVQDLKMSKRWREISLCPQS